ncbi:hypothetical protein B1R94_16740 [Mycolicibacterium litorale]|nr:hypothetical protein B1R94_16740 [Mycolicibacterium litorale]
MAEVTDPEGITWSVRRWWWKTIPWETGFATLDGLIFLVVFPFMLMWPLWLLAKWLGVPWTLVITRDGTEFGRERVAGWRRSGERMADIAASIETGTLTETNTSQ